MIDLLPMHAHLPPALEVNEQALEEVFRHTPVGVGLGLEDPFRFDS